MFSQSRVKVSACLTDVGSLAVGAFEQDQKLFTVQAWLLVLAFSHVGVVARKDQISKPGELLETDERYQ